MNPNEMCFYLRVVWGELIITVQNIKFRKSSHCTGDKGINLPELPISF